MRRQCALLSVSRSSVQYTKKRRPSEEGLVARIELIILECAGYGYRRVTHTLRRRGQPINHKRVQRVMRQHGLTCRVRRRPPHVGSDAAHCPNLLRDEQVVPTAPDQVWQADFTYVRVLSGWLYLACVLDGYSRRVIGWALSKRADAELTCAALQMALDTRQVTPQLIHHSDQGVQYQSQAYQALLDSHHIRKSMSRRASPGDNAKLESLFRSVKVEEVYLNEYADLHDARGQLGHFLEAVYNAKRLHSSLSYRPPDESEAAYHSRRKRAVPLA